MSRIVACCLCASVALVALCGAHLLRPAPALAATGTLQMETPLHDAPNPGAPLIALLPPGTVVSIEGPPVDGFYPVASGDLSGWMRGETLALQKDIPEDDTLSGTPAAEASGTGFADDDVASSSLQTTDEGVAVGDGPAPAANEATSPAEPSPEAAIAEPIEGDIAADPAAAAPLTPVADPATPAPDATIVDLAPEAAGDIAAGGELALAATPVAVAAPEPDVAESGAEPAPPTETPEPTEEAGPIGPASTLTDMPIRSGPGPEFGLIFTVPHGSTVEQTGDRSHGWVSVHYKEITGWAPADQLGAPILPTPETLPEETAEPVETKTSRPGSGVAYTTVDLSLRAGPSASEEPIVVVPAGSRVVLTGVMEGGFQRVKFHDQIGWIADEYLNSPPDPDEVDSRPGGSDQDDYSRKQIVRIIYAAADRYDQSRSDMLRVAECESNLDPYAVNPSGSYGLFQFIRSTWKSTPYGDEDVFDPQANANAAGWMWQQGRKSEWVCQ
jgi:uncharacterized protein YraI